MEKLNLNPAVNCGSVPKYDPAAFAKMKADTINGTPGNETGYDCPKCKNRGFNAIPREDGSVSFADCSCKKIRRCVRRMEASGLKNVIRDLTFEKFYAEEPWQQTIKAAAEEYADKPEGWFVLCGQSGAGKTHICTAICRKLLLDGQEVIYMPWRDDIAELKSLSLDNEHRSEKLRTLKNAQVLYIDDLFKIGKATDGSSNPTSADVSTAFEILNYRYNNRLPTLISTEKTPAELVDIDEAVGSRIAEMAGAYKITVSRDMKRNYRLRGVVTV